MKWLRRNSVMNLQRLQGSVLIAIPISILFLSLQKYFISGLTAGGTKG